MLKKVSILLVLLGCGFILWLLLGMDSHFEQQYSQRIDHSAETVWQQLTSIEQWPQWWPGMEEARLLGSLQVGGQLSIKLDGMPEVPVDLIAAEPNRQLAWQQEGLFGSLAETRIELVVQADATEVTIAHRISGLQARLAEFSSREGFEQYQQLFLLALERQLQKSAGEKD